MCVISHVRAACRLVRTPMIKKTKEKTGYTYNFNRFKILSSIYFISNKKDKRIKDVFDENDKVIFTYLNNNNNNKLVTFIYF